MAAINKEFLGSVPNSIVRWLRRESAVVTASSSDLTKGTAIGSGSYKIRSFATIKAIPNDGYKFKCWQDGSTKQERRVVVKQDMTYVAEFESDIKTYSLTVTSNDTAYGTASQSGTSPYLAGTQVMIYANPTDIGKFVRWNDGNVLLERKITMTRDMSYTAYFEINSGDIYYRPSY